MEEDLKKMLRENLELNQEILTKVKKINRYIAYQKFWSWLKLFLILIPLALGFIYLPAIFSEYREKINKIVVEYQSLIGIRQEVESVNKFLSR